MKSHPHFIVITALFISLMACGSGEDNVPPFCNILDPPGDAIFTPYDDLVIMVSADDTDGSIAGIEVTLDEEVIATSNASPLEYMFNLDGLPSGTYALKARVTDDKGGEKSKEIQIMVVPALEVFTDSRDGNVYRYVTIGDQVWMADNLAYLPSVNLSSESSEATPMYYVSGYEGSDVSVAKVEENYSLYGVLYNWKAATGCCPEGWRLPNDHDWGVLQDHVITDYGEFGRSFYDWGTIWWGMGPHLMHTSGWGIHPHGMNTYGFSALPAGAVTFSEPENCIICIDDMATEWWSNTLRVDVAITRSINAGAPLGFAKHIHYPLDFGLSVRCINNE